MSIDDLELNIDDSYIPLLGNLKEEYKVDFFLARFNNSISTNIKIDFGKMKISHISQNHGFSILVYLNGNKGFAVGNEISKNLIEEKFREAYKLAKYSELLDSNNSNKNMKIKELDPIKVKIKTPQKKNLLDINIEDKLKFLLDEDKKAKNYDKRIINTNSIYGDAVSKDIIITSDKRIIESISSLARIMIFSYSKENDIYESSRVSVGITGGFEIVDIANDIGLKASERAVEILSAKSVKAGKYDIIMDPFLTGTFIHEAFGHACEADAILANESILKGMIGKKLGPDFINVVNDSRLENKFGTYFYDSEGVESKKQYLIKNGILNSFLHSRETSSKMNVEPTGNARAASYSDLPIVRMSNTYIEKGDWSLEELIGEMKNGLLCENWNYGYTQPNIGNFMFKMERAWKIENGEKKELLRDAAISGLVLDVLNNIRAISKDLKLDPGICGKQGQYVPVSAGGPCVFIKNMVIGGL